MKVKSLIHLLLVSVLITILVGFGSPDNSWSQSPCQQTSVSGSDGSCGYLLDKLSAGFGIEFGNPGSGNQVLPIEFAPNEVGHGTIWGGGSDFTWTFNATGSMDPSITFEKEKATFNGTLKASNFLTTGSESLSSNIADFAIDAGQHFNYACGYKFDSPSLGEGSSITNAYGLVLEAVSNEDITHAFGIYQMGENDINSFRGHTGMGRWDGVDNAVLQIDHIYGTDDSNYGIGISVEQR